MLDLFLLYLYDFPQWVASHNEKIRLKQMSYLRVILVGLISSAICALTWMAMYPLLLFVPALTFAASAILSFFDLKQEVTGRRQIVFLWLVSSFISWWIAIAIYIQMGSFLCEDWMDPPTADCLSYKKNYIAARWYYPLLAGAMSGLLMSIGHSLATLKFKPLFYLVSTLLGAVLLLLFHLPPELSSINIGEFSSNRIVIFLGFLIYIAVWQVGMLLWFVWFDSRLLRQVAQR